MQRGQIKRVGKCWLLRYWEPVVKNGQVTKRRVAKKLATYSDQYRTESSVRPLVEAILAPINARTARPESTDTVAHFLEHVYLPHCAETLRPSTVKGYRDMWKLVEPHLGLMRLRDFRTSDADRVLRAAAISKARAHTTLRNVKSFLSGAFRFAKRTDAISENPVRDAVVPRGKPKADRSAYTLDETAAMLKVLPEPARTVVLVAALTGLRLSELKGLRWEDFTDDETVRIERAVWNGKVSETKTLTSKAAVPVVHFLAAALAEHKARGAGTGFVFQGATGQPLRIENLFRRCAPALAEAGIEWRGWHPFRYGVGTLLHSLGTPDKVIQSILRHANVATTMQFYVKPVPEASRAAMRKLESALGKRLGKQPQSTGT